MKVIEFYLQLMMILLVQSAMHEEWDWRYYKRCFFASFILFLTHIYLFIFAHVAQ